MGRAYRRFTKPYVRGVVLHNLCYKAFSFHNVARISNSLNAKKETQFSSKVIAQQLTLCALRWAGRKVWIQLYMPFFVYF